MLPGGGIWISCPTKIRPLFAIAGFSSRMSRIPSGPKLNLCAMASSESFSWIMYGNGSDGVEVIVAVPVGVIVGVSLGTRVLVGVKVRVGVGVSVAKDRKSVV